MARRIASAIGCFAVALSGGSSARSAHAEPRSKKPPGDSRAALPVPKVSLAVDAPTARGVWTMRLTNDGDVPVTAAADARLLTLEVTERGAPRPWRCELPWDMRPADASERSLLIPPKRAYAETFEPRLYCFGAAARALTGGSIVVARLGAAGPENRPPYAVWPVDGAAPPLAPLRSVTSEPVALPDDTTPLPTEPASPGPWPSFSLEGAASVEALSPGAIEIPLTLRNGGTLSTPVRFRPETLAFDVAGPGGVADCAWPTPPGAPTREVFTSVLAGGSATLTVMLGAYCSGHTFDWPGLYVVRPRLDTRAASADTIGMRALEALVIATRPTLVRLHSGSGPRLLARPTLAP